MIQILSSFHQHNIIGMTLNTQKQIERIPALDLLRVIAIGVLVFYHHLMIYVPEWGFHFKLESSWHWLQNLMLLSSPWRLGLLWLVSGISMSFMMNKLSIGAAFYHRSTQLLFPLLIGVLIVVPPQLYVEMKQAQAMPLDFGQFVYSLYFDRQHYFDSFTAGIWPSIDVNHLWFIRSLWQFSLMAILLTPLLALSKVETTIAVLANRLTLLVAILFIIIGYIEVNLSGEIIRELYGLTWFLFGFLFGTKKAFWLSLAKHCKSFLLLAGISVVIVQFGFVYVWPQQEEAGNLLILLKGFYWLNKTMLPIAILAAVYSWLNRENDRIKTLSTYVFPLYIVHQTLSILLAYWLSTSVLNGSLSIEWQMLLSGVLVLFVSVCLLFIIGKFNLFRVGFGMKLVDIPQEKQVVIQRILFCCCLPIGYEILF